MSLTRYVEKRNFSRTPEPKGRVQRPKARLPSFVIQKHAARRLHFDFRLEMEGVLKSWAVPKGLPTHKGERRLAMQVEDHPLEYGGFEGTIPEGNYGAGTVMLWDKGIYEVFGVEPLRALEQGKIHLALHGKKLHGEWTLVRMKPRADEDKIAWLVIKSGEDLQEVPEDKSVRSGKTMDEIARGQGKVWVSNDEEKAARRKAPARRGHLALPENFLKILKSLPSAEPGFVEPMNALLVDNPPAGDNWLFEIKWDGYRALTVKQGNTVKIFSRRHNEITRDFAGIASAAAALPGQAFVLDGELAALDENGHPSFQRLQNARQKSGQGNLFYYVFDLLNLENRDLKGLPLEQRKELLQAFLRGAEEPIRFSASLKGDPNLLLEQARQQRIEGLIGKKRDSVYQPGRRSGAWVKLKITCEQEFVIGGYTQPKGARNYFGALAVGYYKDRQLYFADKVGTGFDEELLKRLHEKMEPLKIEACPFVNLPSPNPRSGGLSAAEMRRCTWIEPKLVCQVRYSEWTEEDIVRQPVFLGLRDDKRPEEVRREAAVSPVEG